jgi:hypothetical protein
MDARDLWNLGRAQNEPTLRAHDRSARVSLPQADRAKAMGEALGDSPRARRKRPSTSEAEQVGFCRILDPDGQLGVEGDLSPSRQKI